MKFTLTLLLGIFFISGTKAQNVVNWQFSSKKIAANTYEVTLKANVQQPWHIYSQTTPDGGPQKTEIVFNKNPLIKLEGKTKELGKTVKKHEDVFGVDVIYLDGNAQFVQTVKVKGNAKPKLSGVVSYMACTDKECLQPTELPFSIALN